MQRSWKRLIGGAFVATLVLAACGSDGKSSPTTAAGGSGTKAATGAPIKLMLVADVGAASSNFPGVWEMANQAQKSINANGGVNGRPLQIKQCNPVADPAKEEACMREAVSGHYVGIVGGYDRNSTRGDPVIEAGKVPWVGGVAINAPDFASPMWFSPFGPTPSAYLALGRQVATDCKKTVVFRLDVAAAMLTVNFTQAGAKAAGGDPSAITGVALPAGAPDLTAQVEQVFQQKPDCIVNGTTPEQALQFFNTARQLGKGGVQVYGNPQNTTIPAWKALGGTSSLLEGAKLKSNVPGNDNPAWKAYNDDVQAAKDGGKSDAQLEPNAMFSRTSWLGVHLAAAVLKSMKGDITSETFLAALQQVTDVQPLLNSLGRGQLGDLVAPVDFTKELDVKGFNRVFSRFVYPAKLVNGAYKSDGDPIDTTDMLRSAFGG